MNFLREAFRGGRVAEALNPEPLMHQFMEAIHAHGPPQQQQQQYGPTAAGAPPSREPVAPPASAAAIRQLPTIRVAPEDLIDTANRECSICLEEHHLGELVLRLPCAHIFHRHCIVDWLQNFHCTCPTCRYELETDHAMFELGRKQRMLQRKLRFAQWELERMSIRELRAIWQSLQQTTATTTTTTKSSTCFVEKSDLLQAILSSPRVDIIHTPQPVSYHMRELQGMSISKLKHAMQEAGVFFDPKDVVEKQDMYQIFKNSGRLILLTTTTTEDDDEAIDNENDKAAQQTHAYHTTASTTTANAVHIPSQHDSATLQLPDGALLVETVDSDDEGASDNPASANGNKRRHSDDSINDDVGFVFMEPIGDTPPPPHPPRNDTVPPSQPQQQHDHHQESSRMDPAESVYEQPQLPITPEAPSDTSENHHGGMDCEIVSEDTLRTATEPHDCGQFDDADEEDMHKIALTDAIEQQHGCGQFDDADDHLYGHGVVLSENNTDPTDHVSIPSYPSVNDNYASFHQTASNSDNEEDGLPFSLQERSISELQLLANFMNINIDQCLEKADMIDCLRQAPTLRVAVKPWSVSVLNAMARLVNMDVSNLMFTSSGPSSQERLVVAILQQAHQQPHVAPFINSLMPMARLNASELKAVARQRGINLTGCPEVGDMFYQLAKSTMSSSTSAGGTF